LEIFSFVYYYPSALVGPSFDFADFKDFIELKGQYTNLPTKEAIYASFKEIAKFVICLGLNLGLNPWLNPGYCTTKEFGSQLLIYRVNLSLTPLVCVL
jgi:hypothetical protein